jgi:hypothetical protein
MTGSVQASCHLLEGFPPVLAQLQVHLGCECDLDLPEGSDTPSSFLGGCQLSPLPRDVQIL